MPAALLRNAVAGIPGFTTVAVSTETYVLPVVASQKAGPIPLGKSMGQPEGTLDPDDQRMQQVIYENSNLWSSVGSALQVGKNTLDGAAYFVITPGRWGDYSAAVAVGDDAVWIATEYIGPKKRDKFTNWGTFIGVLPLPGGN